MLRCPRPRPRGLAAPRYALRPNQLRPAQQTLLFLVFSHKLKPIDKLAVFFYLFKEHFQRAHPEFTDFVVIKCLVDNQIFQCFAVFCHAKHPVFHSLVMLINPELDCHITHHRCCLLPPFPRY